MPTKVVVGVQWGDEGKGKIIDILASRAEVVVRSQGGNNAGHTVESGGEVYKLQLIPSGILYKETLCLLGAGVVINPKGILGEINGLESRGISCDMLRIDPRAHVIMPWDLEIDGLSEKLRGASEIGTTKKGIGPCYMDKAERSGLRMYDLVHPELLAEKIQIAGGLKNRLLTEYYKEQPLDLAAITEEYTAYGQQLAKYLADVSVLAYQAIRENKEVLFEGAQGTLLDIDFGTYPFVTSSHPISGGVCIGSGIGPTMIDEVYGAAKAYTTRVGAGPFPTELLDEMGDKIRNLGHEFGTVTGRPRRCGWFDSVIMRHSVRVNGLTGLAINKIDTLSGLGKLKVCVAYEKADGSIIRDFPPTIEELAECKPVYEEIEGFEGDLSCCKAYEELPESCKRYIERLEQLCECPIKMIGVGPSREQNLER
ncbi:MAG: adenylosuccinate synthase [Oscillospiraceae bacterium]|nr:adenylosuccinate synthase [Oscillospiraceae bacterium]